MTADGKPNGDWVLEEGMVAPVHLLYPGGEHDRLWVEEVVVIGKDGGRPLFSWGPGAVDGTLTDVTCRRSEQVPHLGTADPSPCHGRGEHPALRES